MRAWNPILLALVLCLPGWSMAAAPPDARARTEAFLGALRSLPPAEALAALPAAQREERFGTIDEFFDFDALTGAAIAPRLDRFSPEQQRSYRQTFRELIRRVAWPDAGAFFRKAELTVGEPVVTAEGASVPLRARVVAEDLELTIELRWHRVGAALRLHDLSFDGDSIVRDYQQQFARIIDAKGAVGLLQAIEARRAELDRPPAPRGPGGAAR